ncbi:MULTISPECIES: ASCH domain-containing protein [Cyanophyceae]|uniref:ASCH domain-containing protein n=1 Tax=Leptolyngbya subtilissima DQ-A4 TaxID=2933933 RepID=A0ABV0JZF5_9CYAN|nr:ASCH domain-containing protein [Nodosilinea sp. FACHB-141]MBD2112540.1 ASCH domain-containing protein [Nodosilinea sp. FACHB-141]
MLTTEVAQFPDRLRAMSIHFPFAWAIVHGEKDFEYRTRATKYRGMFLIHSSGTKDSDEYMAEYNIPQDQIIRKAIIGAVELVDCVEDPEGEGYFYELESPIVFEKAIPATGQQSIFWPASTPERVRAFNQAFEQMPKYPFKIEYEDDLIILLNHEANIEIGVLGNGFWQKLMPRIQNGQIDLAVTEIDALLDEIPETEEDT